MEEYIRLIIARLNQIDTASQNALDVQNNTETFWVMSRQMHRIAQKSANEAKAFAQTVLQRLEQDRE